MGNIKCKVGDVVRVNALDLMKYSGECISCDLLPVYVYGKVDDITKDTIVIRMAEDCDGESSNFDERMVLPIGCVLETLVLIKGKK